MKMSKREIEEAERHEEAYNTAWHEQQAAKEEAEIAEDERRQACGPWRPVQATLGYRGYQDAYDQAVTYVPADND